MFKKTAFFLMGCVAVGSVVYALANYDPMMTKQAQDAQIIEDLAIDRPFAALRPPSVWGRLEVIVDDAGEQGDGRSDELAQPPKFVLPPLVIEASVSRLRRRRAARGPRLASLAAPSGPGLTARPDTGLTEPTEPPEPTALEQETPPRESLDRETVAAVMRSMRRDVQRCYDTAMVPGQVNLSLTVEGQSGRVSRVQVDEASTTARCIRGVAGRLRFPRFNGEQLTIEYPYTLR